MKKKIDVEQLVTDQLIAMLEQGTGAWKKSWASLGGELPTRFTGQHYKGINLFILALTGRGNPHWMTFNQMAATLGWERDPVTNKWPWVEGEGVRKDEKGTTIVFYKPIKVKDRNNPDKLVTIPLMKAYTVFNAEQIDGLPEKYFPKINLDDMNTEERISAADDYIKNTGARIQHGGNRAYYSPSEHQIQLPGYEQFEDAVAYYGTALHEVGHWTQGETNGPDRDLPYANEELVAEIYASMTCAKLGIESVVRDDHAQYLSHWLDVIKADKKAIFKAAAHAQKAVDYTDSLTRVKQQEAA
jgi:antirestriction protein ArdC